MLDQQKITHHGSVVRQLKWRIFLGKLTNKIKNIAGFTLIELLIVIAILGILSAFLINVIDPIGQIHKSRDSQRKQDLAQLQRALEAYYNDNNEYPPSTGTSAPTYRINPPPAPLNWGDAWVAYSTKIPEDPDSSRLYLYTVTSNGQVYRIFASLERGVNDFQVCNPDGNASTNDACTNVPAGVSCGTGSEVCNYGISSPNSSP